MDGTIERAFVINLRIRRDRLDEFRKRIPPGYESIFPEVEVWDAVHGDTCLPPDNWHAGNGAWGCYKSHVGILEKCLNENVNSYIVFEDDAVFSDNFASGSKDFLKGIPEDWEMLYFGGQLLHTHSHPPIRITEGVYQPYNVNRTHCFALSRSGMLAVYRHISNLPFHTSEHVDHHLGRFHETYRHKVYCPGKWLVGQGGGPSNVSGKVEGINFFSDPETLAMDHPLFEHPTCIVFRGPRHVVEQLCDSVLHRGYNLDSAGYDRGLCEAWKYKDPATEIRRWYSCVRSEIAREKVRKIPVLWHPRIEDEMIKEAEIGNVVNVETTEYEKAKSEIESVIDRTWGAC